ncbi:hypothetical protein ACJJTC_016977 [Scirpophaga incertulas]
MLYKYQERAFPVVNYRRYKWLKPHIPARANIQKRAAPSKNRADQFVEEKLIEHSRALEHLVNLVEENGQLTKQLVENLSRQISTPKLPERIGISRAAKHTNESDDEDDSNVLVRFGKSIPKFGSIFKKLLLNDMKYEDDPIPLVEEDPPEVSREIFKK